MTVVRPHLLVQQPIVGAERIARHGIERTERLVHQHDGRPRRQRARDADALALPTRQRGRETRSAMSAGKTHEREQLDRRARGCRLRPSRAAAA